MTAPDAAIMIEGQNGLNWERWQAISRLVEELGFAGLYRSDHYTNAQPPDRDSLELWVSLAWLATNSERLTFGPLVTPVSFRHPTMTARMARDVDTLSGGRLVLGLGAGWQEREHNHYGWELLAVPDRMQRFEEGLEVITRLLRNGDPQSYAGQYYRLNNATLLPRPSPPGGPPILIGGNGIRRTIPLVAQFADEWNAVNLSFEEFARRSRRLDDLLNQNGREPASVRRSMMLGCVFGKNDAEVQSRSWAYKGSPDDLRARGFIVGTAAQIVDHLGELAEAGVQTVMLQWLALDDLESLHALGSSVVPQLG